MDVLIQHFEMEWEKNGLRDLGNYGCEMGGKRVEMELMKKYTKGEKKLKKMCSQIVVGCEVNVIPRKYSDCQEFYRVMTFEMCW